MKLYVTNLLLLQLSLFWGSLYSQKTPTESQFLPSLLECYHELAAKETIIVVSERNMVTQYYIDAFTRNGRGSAVYEVSDVQEDLMRQNNIIALGSPNKNTFVQKCLENIPIKLTENSIILNGNEYAGNDINLLFTIPNPYNPEKTCLIVTTNNEHSLFMGTRETYVSDSWSFAATRKSDGLQWSLDDHLVAGKFAFRAGSIQIDSTKVWKEYPKKLTQLSESGIHLFYNTISADEALKFLDILTSMRQTIIDYGIIFNQEITVYLYQEYFDIVDSHSYTDGINTFWSKFESLDELFNNAERKQLSIFGHEMARLAFQPLLTDKEKIGPLRQSADDWSHYFELVVLIPALWEKLGKEAWPIPYNYEKEGLLYFNKMYRGCENTYAALLLEIDKNYGRQIIAETVNKVTGNGIHKYVSFEDFMGSLAQETNDIGIIERVQKALPTPMEHSYKRRIHPIGIAPTLDTMLLEDSFEIELVEKDSTAELAGLKPGDEIVALNGFDVKTEKDLAHRQGLQIIKDGGDFTFNIKRDGEIRQFVIPIQRR